MADLIKEQTEQEKKEEKTPLTEYVWRQKDRSEVLMVDLSTEELMDHYKHASSMLDSEDKEHYGSRILYEILNRELAKCQAELFAREVLESYQLDKLTLANTIKEFLSENNLDQDQVKDYPITYIFSNQFDPIYNTVTMGDLTDACFNMAGKFQRFFGFNFIVRQGLWISKEDTKELFKEDDDLPIRDKILKIKKECGIDANVHININPDGFSYKELKAILTIKNDRYGNLTTAQLKVLRDKVLPRQQMETLKKTNLWNGLKEQLKEVIEYKTGKSIEEIHEAVSQDLEENLDEMNEAIENLMS